MRVSVVAYPTSKKATSDHSLNAFLLEMLVCFQYTEEILV